ncbi:hypothetical protein B566_EDAN011879 [Ephemera danica]|nr:hypothetical protein B566_EDAN011879 [Ephemera danica]
MLFKQRSLKSPEEVEAALGRELQVAEAAASRYPNNYHAWNHRMWAVSLLGQHCLDEGAIFTAEWRSSGIWIVSHVSDHSGLQYREFVLQRIFSLQIEQLVQPIEEWKNAMEYLVNGLPFPSCWGSQECLSHKLGLVIADLRLNGELILQFEGHEALWCHRRFLLFLVLRLARASTCLCAANSYEGAIAQGPGLEAHGGTTYCAVAALSLMGRLHSCLSKEQISHLQHWCISRQISGFQGRPNKPVDTCYSFWVGATLKLLNIFDLIDYNENRKYIMSTQDLITGGFSKWEDTLADPLHTYFGICGLSLMGEEGLATIHPGLNFSQRAVDYLHKLHLSWRNNS